MGQCLRVGIDGRELDIASPAEVVEHQAVHRIGAGTSDADNLDLQLVGGALRGS